MTTTHHTTITLDDESGVETDYSVTFTYYHGSPPIYYPSDSADPGDDPTVDIEHINPTPPDEATHSRLIDYIWSTYIPNLDSTDLRG